MRISKINDFVLLESENKFTNCLLKTDEIDGRLLSVNNKFLAMSSNTTGKILIVDSSKPCDINNNNNFTRGFKYGDVLDIEFCPYNNNLLASASGNLVLLWKIPDGNFNNNAIKDCNIYNKHNKEVNYVSFNPVIKNMLCSSDLDNEIHIWNEEKLECCNKYKLDENTSMISWSPKGDLVGVTTKKQYINILDHREENIFLKKHINDGPFSPKFVWVDDNSFAAVCSSQSKKEPKMLKLWDLRKIKEDNSNEGEIASINIETYKYTNSIPFINRELKLIYVTKRDSNPIYVFNYREGKLKKETYNLNSEITSLALFDKNCLNPNEKEIDKFAIYSKDSVYYASFFPSEFIQISNLYKSDNFINSQFIIAENSKKENNESINEINNKSVEKEENNNEKRLDKGIINQNCEENNVLQKEKFEEDNKINSKDLYQKNKLNKSPLGIKDKDQPDENNIKKEENLLKDISKENELLKSENYELKKENKNKIELQNELNKKNEEYKNMNIKNKNLNHQIKEQEKEINKKKVQINKCVEKISELEKEKEICDKEINEKNSQIDEFKNKISILEQQKKKVKEKESIKFDEEINIIKQKYEEFLNTQLKNIANKLNEKIEKKLNRIKQRFEIYKNKIDIMNESIMIYKSIHHGFKCEKCFKEPIEGIRYKCSVCSNYNLCNECEEKNSLSNEHPHIFIKISKEQNDLNCSNDYSYKCINTSSLTSTIFEGTNEVEFKIDLENNGNKTWPMNNTFLSFDRESDITTDDINLESQKPNETKSYFVKFRFLGQKKVGEYRANLHFYINDKEIGEQLTLKIRILDIRVKDFRDNYSLAEEDFPNERILDILRRNNFDFEKSFNSLF